MVIAPRASADASAELVVPRSMPTMSGGGAGCQGSRSRMFSSSFQRSLPPRATHHNSSVPISVTRLSSVTGNAHVVLARNRQRHFQRAQLLEVVAPVLDQRAGRVALPHQGAQEPELGRLADDQPELAAGDRRAGAFLHAERHDAQRLQWCGQPGDRRHRALDPDVVAACRAAADADAPSAPRQPVVGGALRDGMIQVGRVEHVAIVERLESFVGQPAAQDVDDPRAQRLRLHHAAVEQHVRRAGQAARAAADRRRGAAAGRLDAQEPREVTGDGRIGGVGQADFLQADAPLTRRHRLAPDRREESLEQRLVDVVEGQRRGDRAADQLRAAAEQRDRVFRVGGVTEQRFFREPGLVPEAVQLPGVDLVAGGFQALLEQPRQREIHVVAAEQDVLADGHALERQVAVALGDRNQAEVGGAAADVADEHEIADLDAAAPRVAERVEPGVEGGLGFFEQRHVAQAGALRRPERQLARLLVERGRHGQQDVLLRQRQRLVALRDLGVERGGEVAQVCGRGVHRRNPRDFLRGAPRQDRCRAVRAAVRQPGFCGRDETHRVLGAAASRELSGDECRRRIPGQRRAAGGKIHRSWRIEERGQQRARRDLAGVHQLRDRLQARRPRRRPRRGRPSSGRSWSCRDRCRR